MAQAAILWLRKDRMFTDVYRLFKLCPIASDYIVAVCFIILNPHTSHSATYKVYEQVRIAGFSRRYDKYSSSSSLSDVILSASDFEAS